MAETIKTQICNLCKQEKQITEFYKRRSYKSGYDCSCKFCRDSYWKTETGKKATERYSNTEKAKYKAKLRARKRRKRPEIKEQEKQYSKEYYQRKEVKERLRKYEKTAKRRNYKRKLDKSPKAKARMKRTREKYGYKCKARSTLFYRIQTGEIPPVHTKKCFMCNKQAGHYHHKDYSMPYDVIPLCVQCHYNIHHVNPDRSSRRCKLNPLK